MIEESKFNFWFNNSFELAKFPRRQNLETNDNNRQDFENFIEKPKQNFMTRWILKIFNNCKTIRYFYVENIQILIQSLSNSYRGNLGEQW